MLNFQSLIVVMNDLEYNIISETSRHFFCNNCSFVFESQGGLGVHSVKKHKAEIPDDVTSVSVIGEFPNGKSFFCCIQLLFQLFVQYVIANLKILKVLEYI